ncbi:MAG TPA: type VI secretion system tip protein VgrG [Rhodobacteraceae bacterium]|nr:type VI secretion system tip protein VgrG [Paracoccaceae bacterium]
MPNDIVLENRQLRLKGPLGPKKMILVRADVSEKMSTLTETDIQFISPDHNLKMEDVVGQRLSLELDDEEGNTRHWHGHCISCAFEGRMGGQGLYRAEVRPWLWFLTLHSDCRIFQEKSALEVIKEIFSDRGFSDIQDKTSSTFEKREYLVQYRETDYEFITRLMEEEGMYYYFTHDDSKETLVLADGSGSHSPLQDAAEIRFEFKEGGGSGGGAGSFKCDEDHIYEWKSSERVNTGKVSLTDYDFTKPTTDLKALTAIPKGKHSHKDIEVYDYPGIHDTADFGKKRTRVRAEALASEYKRTWGKSNVRNMAVGGTFKLKEHPRTDFNKEYLVLGAKHKLQIETDEDKDGQTNTNLSDERGEGGAAGGKKESYESEFSVQLKAEPFRAPLTTPQPIIPGVQTAVVTGPSGDEIYTDKYGRIKVQFHWDRVGQKDEKTTCFIRVAQTMSGQGWGVFHIPRIGQEVVVQFEEGNPDRPIVTGMLYNEAKKHPFDFPANMTQHGMKSNTTKGGGGFHELVFEDKKEEEFVRLQSERDYKETIKNNAEISIGFEHSDPGDLTQKIYRNKTEELETGDHSFTVKEGLQTIDIAKSNGVTIGEEETISIGTDKTDDIGTNYTIDVGDTLDITAGTMIKLTVGGSSIEMTSSAIKIKSATISIEGTGKVEVKAGGAMKLEASGALSAKGATAKFEGSGMAEVKAGGILSVKGSVVKIN